MYSKYEFWRAMPDEKNMLTTLRHQVVGCVKFCCR